MHGAPKEVFTSKIWKENERIDFFRKNEYLYNVQHKEYTNMEKKLQKFEINRDNGIKYYKFLHLFQPLT